MFFIPKIIGGVFTIDLSVHSLFKQDSAYNFIVRKSGTFDNAGAHLMNEVKHLFLVAVLIFSYPIEFEGFRKL